MIDPKQLPDDPDAWVKPDISQPRTTPEFINDVWASRKSPVYSLRPLEVAILQSKTFKGWLWRTVVSIVRHKKLPVVLTPTSEEAGIPILPFAFDPTAEQAGEDTMRHYIAVTEKFHPVCAPLPEPSVSEPSHSYYDAMTCTSSALGDATPPKKPRKKPRKKPAKKRPNPAKRR